MRTTKAKQDAWEMNSAPLEQLAVDAESLAAMLGCGRATAVKIGSEAKAKLIMGKRTLYVVSKVRSWLEENAGE